MGLRKKTDHMTSIKREMAVLQKRENALMHSAQKESGLQWKQNLVEKIPEKVYTNLQKAFCKAFATVFEKGTSVIEKTYDRECIQEDYEVQNFAFRLKADRKSLRRPYRDAGTANLKNMALTSVEGIGLGLLGIGLPDIVVFVGVLLRGIYEIALRYGFDYDTPKERYFILKLMRISMLKGEVWVTENEEVNAYIERGGGTEISPEMLEEATVQAADVFAADMLLLKFVQGLPLVGLLGGAGNPVYYSKVMRYVELKYRKRYLLVQLDRQIPPESEGDG